MSLVLKLSWRNIWRNKRRTLITAASVFFSVFFSSFLSSFQSGSWDQMIDSVVNFYYGYAQVQDSAYASDPTIDNAFNFADAAKKIPEINHLRQITPRLEGFALASTGPSTQGAMLIGVDDSLENKQTHLADKVVKGTYFTGKPTALVAEGLAKNLKISVGDTLVLLSQGYHGVNAAGKYLVGGILHFPSPDLNRQMIYIPLKTAQNFFGAPGMVTSLSLDIDDKSNVDKVIHQVNAALGKEFVVKDWKKLMPDLVQARAMDTASMRLILLILYIIIAFGIFGTILMMTEERKFEFGVLVSLGMRRGALFRMIWTEIIWIALLGVIVGIVVAIPCAWYFNVHPIQMGAEMAKAYESFGVPAALPCSTDPWLFIQQAIVVFILTTVLVIYPLVRIMRLKPVEAMHI